MSRDRSVVSMREFILVVVLVGFLVNLLSSIVFHLSQSDILSLTLVCIISLIASSITVIAVLRMENIRKQKTMNTAFRLLCWPIERFMRKITKETSGCIDGIFELTEDKFTDNMRARTRRWLPRRGSHAEMEQSMKKMMNKFSFLDRGISIATERKDTMKLWEMTNLPDFYCIWAAAIQTEPSHADHFFAILKELEATIARVIDFYYNNLPSEILEMIIQLESDFFRYSETRELWNRYSPLEYPLHARQEVISLMLAGQQWVICRRVNEIHNLVRGKELEESTEVFLEDRALRYIIDEVLQKKENSES